jgi:hypothetical protein
MRNLLIIALTLFAFTTFAQNDNTTIQRKGFVFGVGAGAGIFSLSHSDSEDDFETAQGSFSFPNLKLGWMVNERLALLLTFPGMIYEEDGKDRSFESIMPTVQYWVSNKWWVNGGFGLAMDIPAFYNINGDGNESWNFGCAVAAATGFEIVQKERFAIDLKTKLHLGRALLENDAHLDGVALSVGVGFNWY